MLYEATMHPHLKNMAAFQTYGYGIDANRIHFRI
jgi:hypothetical protein